MKWNKGGLFKGRENGRDWESCSVFQRVFSLPFHLEALLQRYLQPTHQYTLWNRNLCGTRRRKFLGTSAVANSVNCKRRCIQIRATLSLYCFLRDQQKFVDDTFHMRRRLWAAGELERWLVRVRGEGRRQHLLNTPHSQGKPHQNSIITNIKTTKTLFSY